MESGGKPSVSTFVSDWAQPITEEELEAIEAAIQSATSSITLKKQRLISSKHDEVVDTSTVRRRLPDSIIRHGHSPALSLSSCPANSKMRYPAMKFGGQIVYSRTYIEVENAAIELLKIVSSKQKETGRVILGFDIEWKPTFTKGVSPGKAAVMQICEGTTHCYVMHIIHSGITQSLKVLLEDSASVMVGAGVGNDAVKVFKDHRVSVKSFEDLSDLANKKLGGDPRKWSLESLTEMVTCKQLQKLSKIKLGNWEADVLSKEQLQYAATDAYASWYLYQV